MFLLNNKVISMTYEISARCFNSKHGLSDLVDHDLGHFWVAEPCGLGSKDGEDLWSNLRQNRITLKGCEIAITYMHWI